MTREEAIKIVRKYDHVIPRDLYEWLDYVDLTEDYFYSVANKFRSSKVWVQIKEKWVKENIWDSE